MPSRRRAHQNNPQPRRPLLPPEIRAQLPKWGSTAEQNDPVATVKLFMPGTVWTWYVVEFDGDDICFGLVSGLEVEAGNFSISEIEEAYDGLQASGTLALARGQGIIILPAERDLHFTPTKLSELRRLHRHTPPQGLIP